MSTTPTPGGPAYGSAQPPMRVILENGPRRGGWMTRLPWILLGIAVMVIISMYSSYQGYFQTSPQINERYHSLSKIAQDKVAIIKVDGTIMHNEGFEKWQIDRVREDDSVKAIVLRVDSPGGTVTGSNYIYHHLKELAAEKEIPLVVSMGGIAASGGYYVAMAVGNTPDSIFAEATTWTGSIGVIIPHYDLSGLLAKWEVEDDSIVSHPLKGMLSPTKEMNEKERAILQELVDQSFADFKDIVRSGRPNMTDEKLDEVATGQIFTAKQALEHGLVDKIGYLDEAIARVIELAGLSADDVRVVQYEKPKGLFDDMLLAQSPSNLGMSALLEMTAPRAYYLCTWLPGVAKR